jgi:hypothetical protein
MSRVNIHGAEYAIRKVFSDDFVFTIPLYQRPYAWTTEQAEEMLEDFITFLGDDNEPIEEVNPYFLGSIVLIKEDTPDAQVVDGQQRLTTLTILLAALRASVPTEHANDLTTFLYQKGSLISGTPNRYRLTLRERDQDFFKKYIQDEGGINKLKDLSPVGLSDSQQNIKENGLRFLWRLEKLPEPQRVCLAQFIVTRCFLVVVSTPDLDSAYRIFSVLNNRGLDLSLPDILKADIIGKIPEQKQEAYSRKWEDTEQALGRERFEALFSHIRMINRKAKLRESVIKEFRQYVHPTNNPQHFIDKTLCPYADAFSELKNCAYENERRAEQVNQLFWWLNRLDNSDWVPPAILYLSDNRNNPDQLEHFFTDLERLAAGLMIQRSNINERLERYSQLLTAIEREDNLFSSDSPLQLTREEQRHILKILDGDLYSIQKIRLYVLQRLDTALSKGNASYDFSTITIEHVLPQKPAQGSEWETLFPSQQEREKYVHRLGNLVLLSRRKNSEAQNFKFEQKKKTYFSTHKDKLVSPFTLTTQVLREQEWTPAVIEKRQKELIGVLKKVWCL